MRLERNLAELAHNIRAKVTDLGIRVSPGSRLDRMSRLYLNAARAEGSVSVSHPDFAVACEGVRDMLQLDFILCALTASAIPAGFSDRLKMALHDAALPQDSHAQTRGRDTQCELYVAAVCARAGLLPTLDEPDINCCHAGLTYGIAVKRLKSLKRFDERFREASEQICRCGLPGIIVIDLSLANNPENFPVTLPLSDAQYEQAAKELIRRFIDNQFMKLTEQVRGKNVQGLILLNHDIRQQANGGWGLDSATMATHLSPYNGRRRRIVDGFFKQFMKGLATSS